MKSIALALLLASSPAMAQFAVDGSIGVAVPVGSSHTGSSAGLDLMGAFEWHPLPVIPFALRAEVGYDHIGGAADLPGDDLVRFDADAVLDIPVPVIPLRPYVLAGVGVYHLSAPFGYGATDPGFNIGGGLRYPFGPLQGFFEVRFHDALFPNNYKFIPFQFGLRFPF